MRQKLRSDNDSLEAELRAMGCFPDSPAPKSSVPVAALSSPGKSPQRPPQVPSGLPRVLPQRERREMRDQEPSPSTERELRLESAQRDLER